MTKDEQTKDLDPNQTHGNPGVLLYAPSVRLLENGIEAGDFLGSTSLTKAVDSFEKFRIAIDAPDGTELLLVRNNKRLTVVLGKGITEREQ